MLNRWIRTITRYFDRPAKRRLAGPIILTREKHPISRAQVSPEALKVLYRLHKAGFQAYLVGGCVRDLLLGHQPKDFDVATNAYPEQVRQLFSNCRLIGRRFRLAHVYFGDAIIEVATFRGPAVDTIQRTHSAKGMILRDNVYGTLEEDAWRRDFGVNALYYNIADFSIVDYTNGLVDLQRREIRILGDPSTRFHEDPVRILRAIRFAAKLDLKIAPDTAESIPAVVPLLQEVPPSRLFDEVLKLFHSGAAMKSYTLLQSYGIFAQLFPDTHACITEDPSAEALLCAVLRSTDARITEGKPVSAAFLLACLLWAPLCAQARALSKTHTKPIAAWMVAIDTIGKTPRGIQIPSRLFQFMRDIWILEKRLTDRLPVGKLIQYVENHSFRAAYDFLLLRQSIGEPLKAIADWWTAFHAGDAIERAALLEQLPTQRHRRPTYRRKKPST